MDSDGVKKEINLLVSRLERLSADSILAHRASGIRGSLLRCLEELDGNYCIKASDTTDYLIDQGYWVLEQAVKHQLIPRKFK
jgi:hypothetical protein